MTMEFLLMHQQVQEEQEMSSTSFKQMLKLREVARQAFHTADNSPSRGQFAPGQWVMIWRTQGPNRKRWAGPQRTIIQESDHTAWTSQSGRLFQSAPENVRLALPEEGHPGEFRASRRSNYVAELDPTHESKPQ